jgi:DNA-binding CsgD family transcriptional regulator/tetratricopeptide (TPR) repeat protein
MDMTTGTLRPLVCPVLIGRASYLEALLHLMEQVCAGSGQTVLIAGEAGIGKSRLITEAATRMTMPQAQVPIPAVLILQGRCFEPDTALPYAPLLDALRSFLTSCSPDEIAHAFGPATAELIKLLPELATLVPASTSRPVLEPEQEKRRLFQALTLFFAHLAATGPLLLILEDVHWSDEASLEFLLYLARRIASHPILLLLTYRSEQVQGRLARFLIGVDRERLATELTLSPLNSSEVAAMIGTIFGLPHAVPANVLEMIVPLAEGNPFFLEEILKALLTAGEIETRDETLEFKPLGDAGDQRLHLPRSVQLAVQQRLDHLSPDARHLLDLAAVAGRRFDFGLLQALTEHNEIELVHLVKQLILAQLVVEESPDVFAFRHALTQQAVYADLLVRERKALHRLIAQTMEHLYADAPEGHLGDLAYHFYAAGVWEKVLEYAQRAGEQAQSLYAPRSAIEHFTHALEAARHLSLIPSSSLYRARGQAYETLGEFELARADYEQALDAGGLAHDSLAEWQSLFDLGFLWTGRDYMQASDYLQRALELARSMGDPSTLAHSLNRLGNWHANVEEPLEGQRYHQEALTTFQELNDQRGMAETLHLLGVATSMGGDMLAGARYYEQAIARWRAIEDPRGLLSSLVFFAGRGFGYVSTTLVCLTTSEAECIREGEEAIALGQKTRVRSDEAFAHISFGLNLGPRGEYGRAFSGAETGLNIAREIKHGPWMATGYLLLGILSLELLVLPSARQHLELALTLAKDCGSLFLIRGATAFLASACIAQGDVARATMVLDEVFGPETPCQTMAQRLVWCARAELALAEAHPDTALLIIDRLISTAVHVEDGEVIPRLWHLRGEALIALGSLEEAQVVLCSGRDAAQRQGARPFLWRICVTLGKCYRMLASRERAAEAFAQARTTLEELASTLADHDLRATFLRQASAQLPPLRQSSPRHALRQAFGGLTEREREVAVLVAQGKSTRAIADELIVSERTIEKHVEGIMSKLGFTSRVQIAAWVVEKDLLHGSR